MKYQYVGLIKRNTETSRVLVMSEDCKYYVWETDNDNARSITDLIGRWFEGIPTGELSLATPRQIEVGRGTTWVPNQSHLMVSVSFYGIVSGGKNRNTILVKSLSDDWRIIVLPYDTIKDLKRGDFLEVDSRFLYPARDDHIKAGLGIGKLKRRKRVFV